MIDFHSHILPKMDDGSRSYAESMAMLKELSNQGIETVIATPHFYANDESVAAFLERRDASFERIREVVQSDISEIKLGAEVRYYEGISRLESIEDLCIEGTNLLLLEMPFSRWTEYTINELTDICCSGKVILVLAHIDRYLKLQKWKVFDVLLRNGALMQINAGFINSVFTKRKAIGLLKSGAVHFIGSDCHNMANRAPDIGRAYGVISKKLGSDFLSEFVGFINNFIITNNLKG